jgi:hypothetical protein
MMAGEYQIIKRTYDFANISRYGSSDLYRNEVDEFLETYIFRDIPIKDDDIYVLVDAGWENRLDLIAYEFYKNSDMWWVIAAANNLPNPCLVPFGTQLRVPGLSTLWGYRGIMLR